VLVPPAGTLAPTQETARRAGERLAAFAGIGFLASLWFTAQLALGPPTALGASGRVQIASAIAAASIVGVSALVFLAARKLRVTGQDAYTIGLAYLIAVSLVASLARHAPGWAEETRGLSPIVLLVMLFPVLVPGPPVRAAFAGAGALAASLAAWAITVALGADLLTPIQALRVFQGEILAIPLGLLAGEVVHGLGERLEEARRLGSYELLEKLGAGGMGEVWKARHATLARPAAVKIVKREALDVDDPARREALLARFEREAMATASLTCPHTVEVYDFGVEDDGTIFYVMELLDGIDLHEMVARHGTLPPERVVYFLKQACRSLAEAHDRGLVHRDVKPSNLVACRLGDEVDYLKVLDFGLVTPLRPMAADDRFTRLGQTPGTPAYMAPEQALNPLEVDGRADIYSLGCVAFWLLTRTHLFDGSQAEVSRQHAQDPAPAPSSRSPRKIPPELDAVILRCLAKAPADRPRDARVLAALLAAVPLGDPWTETRAANWWSEFRPTAPPTPPQTPPQDRIQGV